MIEITPAEVHNVATNIQQVVIQMGDELARMEQRINSLNVDWEGISQENFIQEFQRAAAKAKTLIEKFRFVSDTLHFIADRYATADRVQLDFSTVMGDNASVTANGETFTQAVPVGAN